MRELIEYMAKSLAQHPDDVRVTEAGGHHHTIYRLHVAQEDIGRMIGKGGRVANAMRALLNIAAIKQGRRVTLDIE